MFYVNDEPKGKFICTETIKLYCIALYCTVLCLAVTCYFHVQWNHLDLLRATAETRGWNMQVPK